MIVDSLNKTLTDLVNLNKKYEEEGEKNMKNDMRSDGSDSISDIDNHDLKILMGGGHSNYFEACEGFASIGVQRLLIGDGPKV